MTRVGETAGHKLVWSVDRSGGLSPSSALADGLGPPYVVVSETSEHPGCAHFGCRQYEHLRDGIYIAKDATEEQIAALFSEMAPTYESSHVTLPFNLAVYELLSRLAKRWSTFQNFANVLDFGCGTGLAAAVLEAEFPGAVHLGFDLARNMRVLAAERGLQMVEWNGESLALQTGSVDVVVSAFVLGFLRTDRWYNELGRIIRPGGTIAFNLFNPRSDWRQYFSKAFERVGFSVCLASEVPVDTQALKAEVPVIACRRG
jgi:predicted TPR repeat methyltransferase